MRARLALCVVLAVVLSFGLATPAAAVSTVSCIGTSMHISTAGAALSFGSYQVFGTGPNLVPAPVGGNQHQGLAYAQNGTVTVAGPNNPNVWTGVTVQQADGVGYTLIDTIGTVTCPNALAVTVSSFSAHRAARGVLVRWRTASEFNLLGFNVYGTVNGKRVRVNQRLIRTHGRGAYSFLDRKPAKAARYWIQAVNLDGSRSWHGPARVIGSR